MKLERRWWYVIKRHELDRMYVPLESMMDMLRYDAARVESNAPAGLYLLSKSAEGYAAGQGGPCVERWTSFGIEVYVISKGQYSPGPDDVNRVIVAQDEVESARRKR